MPPLDSRSVSMCYLETNLSEAGHHDLVLMKENPNMTTMHKARYIKMWMCEFGVQHDWAAQSPDLNSTKHLQSRDTEPGLQVQHQFLTLLMFFWKNSQHFA
ncbi:hypothetical protein AMECASPLE_037147 [Ameca splendens]|uniref:Uncharacterized protein n=1 Tax=Ameca splendens TaxID=208324 RepID=A0ABV0ZSM5_9TELE